MVNATELQSKRARLTATFMDVIRSIRCTAHLTVALLTTIPGSYLEEIKKINHRKLKLKKLTVSCNQDSMSKDKL
jgi:hypothetical protein